jgi:lactate permease
VAVSGVATPEELCEVATFIILQLSLMFFITAFLILMMTDRTKIMKNLTIALFVGAFSITVQFCCAHFIGPETPAILGSVAAIIAMLIYNKLFIKKECDYDKREELLEEMCDLCYHLQRNFILRCVYTRRFASCKYRR